MHFLTLKQCSSKIPVKVLHQHQINKGKKLKVAKNREQRNREALKEYLGGTYRCEHCGFEHPTSAPFDFHHINPDEKEGEIGHLVRSASIKRLEKEVDKCILLCSNCHRIEHERLRNEQKNSNS